MSIQPPAQNPRAVNPAAPMFPLVLFVCLGTAGLFGYSWRERGLWPLIEGMLMSITVTSAGLALVYHTRAQSFTKSASIRVWMRPTAVAVMCLGAAIAIATVWRGLANVA